VRALAELLFRAALTGLTLTWLPSGCVTLREYQAQRHVESGQVMLASDNLDEALEEFQKAAELAPLLAVVHSNLGAVYRRKGEYEAAVTSYSEAVRLNPFSFEDTFSLAQVYHFTRRFAEAVRTYLRAVDLRPDEFDAQLNLGVCYQQQGDHAQAAERFRRAIQINPHRPQAYVNLGVALDAQGHYYEAIQAYKEALERDNRQPLVLVNLARTYMNQDRLKLARLTLVEAVNIDPSLAAAHEALGYCLFRSRDFGAAERSYLRALECNPRLPHARAGLGSIYMIQFLEDDSQTDLRDRAMEQWHRSLELDPDQPRIRKLIARYGPKPSDPGEILLSSQ
jgi:tetratricopeptide (TPR) repeat protein